jgi:hypothetical protein
MPIFLYDTCHPYDNLAFVDLNIMLVVLFSCACSQTNPLQQTGLKLSVVLIQSIMKLFLNVLKPLKTGDTQHTSCGLPAILIYFVTLLGLV